MAPRHEGAHARRVTGWRIAAWTLLAGLVALPAIAMQFTDEVRWSTADFVLVAAVFGAAGGVVEVTVRKTRSAAHRAAVALTVVTSVLVLWIAGAVGIIGDEREAANRLYLGVLALIAAGSALARFRPPGMARILVAAAAAQATIGVVALAAGCGSYGASWPFDILGLTVAFTALWLIAGWLFRRAAHERSAAR